MSVGAPQDKNAIDARAYGLSVQTRDLLVQIGNFKVFLDSKLDAELTSLGYSAAEVTLLRAAATDLDALRKVATWATGPAGREQLPVQLQQGRRPELTPRSSQPSKGDRCRHPQASHPGTYGSGFSTTVADTTTSSVTAGNKIIGVVTWWGGAGFSLSSVAGGALTWTIDRQNTGTGYRMALISADAPSGLASSTAITATFTGSSEARGIRFLQVDGLANNPTAADGTADLPHQTGSSFSIAITVGTSGDFVVGAGWVDFNTTGASWTSPATEIGTDWTNVDGGSYSWAYKTGVSSGSQAMAGTNGGNDFTGIAAAYLVSGGGGGGTVDGSPTLRPGFMVRHRVPPVHVGVLGPLQLGLHRGTGSSIRHRRPHPLGLRCCSGHCGRHRLTHVRRIELGSRTRSWHWVTVPVRHRHGAGHRSRYWLPHPVRHRCSHSAGYGHGLHHLQRHRHRSRARCGQRHGLDHPLGHR
jgi:hypothetical protein